MMEERLAEIRRDLDSEAYTSYLPKTVRELLDYIDGLKFANGVLDSAAKDAQAWSVRAQTAEAKCAQLEAHKAESMQVFAALQIQEIANEIGALLGSGVPEQILPWIKSAKVQLEAQRGELARELDLTKREAWTAKERHKDEKDRADGLRERLDELNAEDFARAQRGGAVVVPAWNRSDFDKVPPEWSEMQCFGAGYELAASRIQPIPADRVLGDGMVGVDRKGLQGVYEALAYSQPSEPSVVPRSNSMAHRRALGFCADALRSAKGEVEG